MRMSITSCAVFLAVIAAVGLANIGNAQQPAPIPAGTKAPAIEPAKVEEKVRCDRDIRSAGSIIGTRKCQTASERKAEREKNAIKERLQRENAQEFLARSLTNPSEIGNIERK